MKILLIDDDKDDQYLFCEAVREISASIECKVADDGAAGLSMLVADKQLPDLVFLDLNMPVMDGRQTLNAIRSTPKLAHLRVVIYSTSTSRREMNEMTLRGARYMAKPTTFELLVQSLITELACVQPNESSKTNVIPQVW